MGVWGDAPKTHFSGGGTFALIKIIIGKVSQYIHDDKIKKLEELANQARELLIGELTEGMADIFTALYFHILNHDPKNPDWEERDRLFLSNGHICPIRYAVMAMSGYFPLEELQTLRKFGSRLQGHPERERLPGVETTSGPLGSGLGQAAGYAYAARMDGKKFRVYCAMSDGEQETGNIWESAMFAGKYKLNNLTGIIDRNNIQIDGMVENIMPLEPLRAKYEAFNWHVIEIDGHNFEAIIDAVEEAKAIYEKPTLIIAHTIPGKGIKEMEFDYKWHGVPPKPEEAKKFLDELRTLGGKIASEHQ
ncbi:MAG: Transketolase domain protein [Parcubacteria group bacterium GW2011_GWA1_47_9]|nr:MAG: Transketolase domain protein [Parcubacteria group bacterium GW2011_GWA1_47_9]